MNVTVNEIEKKISNDKYSKFVVFIPTIELYNDLMRLFHDKGIKWGEGGQEDTLTKNYFGIYDKFCVSYDGLGQCVCLMYGELGYYQGKKDYIYTLMEDKPSISAMMSRLGIEKSKPFNIEDNPFNPYTFDGKFIRDKDGDYASCDIVLSICAGEAKIVNYTFPMVGKDYFFITEIGIVDFMEWTNNYVDYCFYMAGNAFPTKEKATAHIDEIMEKYNKIKGDIEK